MFNNIGTLRDYKKMTQLVGVIEESDLDPRHTYCPSILPLKAIVKLCYKCASCVRVYMCIMCNMCKYLILMGELRGHMCGQYECYLCGLEGRKHWAKRGSEAASCATGSTPGDWRKRASC